MSETPPSGGNIDQAPSTERATGGEDPAALGDDVGVPEIPPIAAPQDDMDDRDAGDPGNQLQEDLEDGSDSSSVAIINVVPDDTSAEQGGGEDLTLAELEARARAPGPSGDLAGLPGNTKKPKVAHNGGEGQLKDPPELLYQGSDLKSG